MGSEANWPLYFGNFDWSSEEAQKKSLDVLVELATKASCSSDEEVVERYADFCKRQPELNITLLDILREREWPADELLSPAHTAGLVLAGNKAKIWLLLRNPVFRNWDCDAIEVSLAHHDVAQDGWTIASRNPLLLCSLYRAVVGFRKEHNTAQEVWIVEGDSGWG